MQTKFAFQFKQMQYNNIVAILGANSVTGQRIAESISVQYPLLLMDADKEALAQSQKIIQARYPDADITILECSKEASWEADIVIIAVEKEEEQERIAERINEFTTCKIVIQIRPENNPVQHLQHKLPYAKFMLVDWGNTVAIVEGKDEMALSVTGEIIHLCGLQPIFKKSLI